MRVIWDEAVPERVEVVVVGAGIAGVSTALALAQRGVDTVLVEREFVASGASGRNDGQLLLEAAECYSRMTETLGRDAAREVIQFKVSSQAALEQFLSDNDLEKAVDWSKNGSYFLPWNEAEKTELLRSAELLVEDGFSVEWHDASTVRARIGAGEFDGGLYAKGDALVQPLHLTQSIAQAACDAGARMVEQCPVHEVTDTGVVTSRGRIDAEMTVLATNAWTGELLDRGDWIWPIRGQILATQPVEAFLDVGCSTNHGYEYWRQSSDGRLVAGGFRWTQEEAERGYGLELNAAVQDRIESYLLELYGERFGDLRVEHRWCGTMGFSFDGLPLVGPMPGRPRVWLAAGFTGYGMSMGFGVGEAIADLIAEGETAYPVRGFNPARVLDK